MTVSIRLDPETEAKLRHRLRVEQRSLSGFVRQAILEKLNSDDSAESPYELGEHLFGKHGSGEHDRSSRRKEILKETFRAQHRR